MQLSGARIDETSEAAPGAARSPLLPSDCRDRQVHAIFFILFLLREVVPTRPALTAAKRVEMSVEADALRHCQQFLPGWTGLSESDFEFAPPKGFSSFTMAIRCRLDADPAGVLYRRLAGKTNAILDFEDERHVYLTLADAGIAAACHGYTRDFRIEALYQGRTLTAEDLRDDDLLRQIGEQLATFHSLAPAIPQQPFFDRLHARWAPMAREVLTTHRERFPAHEQAMCDALLPIVAPATLERVRQFLPDDDALVFCHNDTYHGNIFLCDRGHAGDSGDSGDSGDAGTVRLLDFEFSCMNHRAFDIANLFAETKMRHGLSEYPYFAIDEPDTSEDDVAVVVNAYLAHLDAGAGLDRDRLVRQALDMVPLSDFMYAMAALPLALEPIQKIQFIPYALQRFERFVSAWEARFA